MSEKIHGGNPETLDRTGARVSGADENIQARQFEPFPFDEDELPVIFGSEYFKLMIKRHGPVVEELRAKGLIRIVPQRGFVERPKEKPKERNSFYDRDEE